MLVTSRQREFLRCAARCAVMCLIVLGLNTTPALAQTGLVGAYAFDEGTGTTVGDASGAGNNGTITGATWTPSGRNGGALSFNGSNALVTIPNTASLQLSGAMTVEAWINPSTVTGAWRDIIYKANDIIYLEASSTNASSPVIGATFSGGASESYGTGPLAANVWTHLAATYDGIALRLYVNGVQVSSAARTGTLSVSTNPVQIGGDSLYGQYFQGLIDDVRIYNVALTAAQVQ